MKVLKFGAVWCPGCLIMKPRWKEIEEENPWLKNEYFDYDENNDIAHKWNVSNILPVFIFLNKNGEEIIRISGEYSKNKLIELITKYKDL
ncbi:MAG: thioredoxin family protein [Tenericutes bacterium]|jgi:thiol-disulfide isomerase/thioredoxin|nr:thioredoxin family protein [Bacilli bacterium]MDD3995380.1 thioredoxin family protein [Bacilli bacterium]MDD4624407.1 thioredoxin family protein [Bacilli bacterium]MDD4831441.1 thioredoxin family protein [Bacilli bacterium]NLV90291.1 thioredoxin family protein [Mycoplasmatota bacterium]